jgi:predicted nucleic acid-binding protein
MKIPKLYIDTSVLGGYYDPEFQDDTRQLWKLMGKGYYRFYMSPTVINEIQGAPEKVRALTQKSFSEPEQVLSISEEITALATAYMEHRIVTAKYTDDAVHVAFATVYQMDYLVSWNFKHLVNIHRKDAFNGVNMLHGYQPVHIINPKELIYD